MNRLERILLIQPPVTSYQLGDFTPNMPLGLAYIAAVLEKNGYQVKILDALIEGWQNIRELPSGKFQIGLTSEQIKEEIKNFMPNVVGISSMFTSQWHNVASIAQLVKELNKDIPVVVGGAHPTAVPDQALDHKSVDFAVVGEGEVTFLELLKRIENSSDLASLKGLAFKRGGGKIINYRDEFIKDLDTIPFPARHLLPLEKYFSTGLSHGGLRKRRRFSPIVTSRGCPARCIFCSAYKMWGRHFRARSPENVIAEIKYIKDSLGIEEMSIEDDNFTYDKERASKICDLMVQENLDIAWDTPNGIALYSIDEELIKKMKESGCYRLSFAIESGNQEFLNKVIKKPLKLEFVPQLINYARRLGIEISVFFIVGIPGETEKTIRDSFRFSRKIGVFRPFISIATPYPGTQMLDLCEENGYLVEGFDQANLTIKQYNIQTPALPINKLKKILGEENFKLHLYDSFDMLIKPKKLFQRFKKAWKKIAVMN